MNSRHPMLIWPACSKAFSSSRSRANFLAGLFNFMCIGEIARPRRGSFVLKQALSRDKAHRKLAVYFSEDAVLPGLIERHSVDLLNDVDSVRFVPDLNCALPISKIFRAVACEGCPKAGKRIPYCFAVPEVGANEQIQILRGTRFDVDTERVTANNEVLNTVLVEQPDQLLEILWKCHAQPTF